MRGRIGGALAGWFVGVAPLLAVNVANAFGLFTFAESVLSGVIALIGGVIAGGVIAGVLGGRAGRGGGAWAGSVAGLLYAVTQVTLVIVTGKLETASILATHPIRISAAVLFFALILFAIALGVGALATREPDPQPATRRASPPPASSPSPYASDAARGRPPQDPPRYPVAASPDDRHYAPTPVRAPNSVARVHNTRENGYTTERAGYQHAGDREHDRSGWRERER